MALQYDLNTAHIDGVDKYVGESGLNRRMKMNLRLFED